PHGLSPFLPAPAHRQGGLVHLNMTAPALGRSSPCKGAVTMIASVKCTQPKPDWHPRFLDMLPAIRTRAGFAFRDLDVEARDEAMQQVTVNTFIAFGQLVRQHRAHLASPSALARFAVAQIRIGRCLDTTLNS